MILRWHLYQHRVILTDHKSLEYILTQKERILRQRRWLGLLKDNEVSIQYYPGKADVATDAFCRRAVQSWSAAVERQASLPDRLGRVGLVVVSLGVAVRL